MTIRTIAVSLLLIPFCAHAQHASPPMDRNHSVLNAFQIMCNLETPVFSAIDAKAAAMRMTLQRDDTAPAANGTITHDKVWSGGLTSGPFILLIDELSGSKGTVTSCAIAAQVPDVDAFRAAAMSDMKVKPAPEQTEANGARFSEWAGINGPGNHFIIRTIEKGAMKSVMVKIVSMQPRK